MATDLRVRGPRRNRTDRQLASLVEPGAPISPELGRRYPLPRTPPLTLTEAGAERLDAYIDIGAHRERQLLEGLSHADKRQLDELLTKLVDSLDAELGH